MNSIVKKIWRNKWMLRSLPWTLYFNFHYLPFRQAIRLPIILYKPKLLSCKGSVTITTKNIKTGMIRLGVYICSVYPNAGIIYKNNGGKIVFNGTCVIGNNSALTIGSTGSLEFGNKFSASTSLRIASRHSITFGKNTRIGWECLFMDTDFHKMTKVAGGYSRGYGRIRIGDNNWIGTRTVVLKNTYTPDYCIVSARSLLNKKYDIPPYSVIGLSSEMTIKREGVWRNVYDDVIEYESSSI